MDWLTDWFLALVAQTDNPVALLVMAASAAIEYVFPPFPGDTITLLGAILITGYGWSFGLVLGAVMLGSIGGSLIAFRVGIYWGTRRARRGVGAPKTMRALDRLVAGFERHGPIYLVLNRFVPGARALFFVAAGLAGMRTRSVVLYSAISAALWNLGLIAVGSLLGANLERLEAFVRRYTTISWIAVVAVSLVVAIVLFRSRTAKTPEVEASTEEDAAPLV